MNWLFFALLAPALYATVVFIDKYIVGSKVKNYRCLPIFASIAGFIGATVLWLFTRFSIFSVEGASILFFVGILNIVLLVLYYEAVSEEEASIVNILFQMFPILVLLFSAIFLKEIINVKQLIGFLIILTSIFGVTYKKTKKRFTISKAFYLILLYDVLWAASVIILKYYTLSYPVHILISFQGWGTGVGGLLFYFFFPAVRQSFKNTLHSLEKKTVGILFINESLFIIARSVTFFAFSFGPTALVSVLEGTTVFYGIVYGVFATKTLPAIFKEDISVKAIQKKLFFALLLFAGILFIY